MAKVIAKHSTLKVSVWKARGRALLDLLVIVLLAAACVLVKLRFPRQLGQYELIVLGVIAVLAAVLLLRARSNWHTAAVRRGGASGEDAALRQLRAALPDSYTILTNLTLTDGRHTAEMDLTVVGPGGVSVVEVKNYSGSLYGKASDRRLTHSNDRHTETPYNPMQQAATHARRLSDYLAHAGQQVRPRAFVYFVNPRLSVQLTDRSDISYFTSDRLSELAKMLQAGRPQLNAAQVRAIIEVLKAA